jgi:pilus assembly protein CpaB
MVVVVAFVMATVATASIFFYVSGVKKQAKGSGETVEVIVSKQDIPTGTRLDDLIQSGAFTTDDVPTGNVVDGAVTSLSQLNGRVTSTPILAGEQIPTARLQGSQDLPGGQLGIPAGFEAISVPVEPAQIAGGAVHPGDHVTIFGTFTEMGGQGSLDDVTSVLVPDARIVKTTKPSIDQGPSGMMITLALRPGDAQKVVFAQNSGNVWMGLLPPGQVGASKPRVTIGQVAR